MRQPTRTVALFASLVIGIAFLLVVSRIGRPTPLTLEEVPPRMGGAAGGALQTGQRIGSALGTALVMSVYQVTATATDSTTIGLRVALGTAVVVIALALAVAIYDLRSVDRLSER